MRKRCLPVLIIVILLAAIFLFIPICSADPALTVYSYSLSPEIFMPGDNGVLTLTIKNAETTNTYASTATSGSNSVTATDNVGATIANIYIESDSDSYKKYVKAVDNFDDIGYITPTNTITIDFELRADVNITEGLYFPIVVIDVEESGYEDANYPVKVKVSNSSVDLIKASIPSKVSMSGSTDITLTAVNNRDASVNAVTITPQQIDGVEFVQDSIFVGDLESYSSEDVTFSIIPSETGVKNLTFDISFKNGDNLHSNYLDLSVEVIETLDVAPVLYSFPSTISKGTSSKVRLEVYNAKSDSISGVLVTPVSEVTVSPSQYFIGSMDADDVFSASFDVITDDLDIGSEYSINFKVSFKQGDNYYETPAVSSSFKVIKPVESGGGEMNLIFITIFIIIIIGLFLFYRLKKRKTVR